MHPSQPGTILLLNGASSSGKSSILKILQDRFKEPYLDCGIDKFIWMLPARYLERPLWDDVLGLAVEAGETGRRLFSAMHRTIAGLSAAGVNVVADHVLVERDWWKECASLFRDLPAYLIKVYCPLEVLVQREKIRENRTLGQASAQYPLVHQFPYCDLEIDTSQLTVDECAALICQMVESGQRPHAFKDLDRLLNLAGTDRTDR